MDIKVYPGRLSGQVAAPPSKSVAHRVLICAALAEGTSVITGISGSKDMEATMGCLNALGAGIVQNGSTVEITGIGGCLKTGDDGGCAETGCTGATDTASGQKRQNLKDGSPEPVELDCIESGSTLRFLLPVAAALGRTAAFTGRGKLPERPMSPLADRMKMRGVTFSPDGRDCLPFTISGQMTPGVYEIPGDVSSQYISGLLFALPLLSGDSEIRIIGELQSASYIQLTLGSLKDFGIEIRRTESGFAVPGGQRYRACNAAVEGDWSNAAFWLVAGAMGGRPGAGQDSRDDAALTVTGLRGDSSQGDLEAVNILRRMGAGIVSETGDRDGLTDMTALRAELLPVEVDCGNIPDIVPVLSVAAAAAGGTTRFMNAGRLRIKESDRLAAMADCLGRLGVTVREEREELEVTGGELRGGCRVSGYNDHRIVMSMAVAALCCREPVIISDAQAVAKSYPDFFEEFRRLGGRADVINSGK